jgi:hypothetical protein
MAGYSTNALMEVHGKTIGNAAVFAAKFAFAGVFFNSGEIL